MRKLVMSLSMMIGMTSTASADYIFVVPQKPGGGTTVWTEIVAKNLPHSLVRKLSSKLFPAQEIFPTSNKFHNDLQKNDKTVMVSHGGNGVSFFARKR